MYRDMPTTIITNSTIASPASWYIITLVFLAATYSSALLAEEDDNPFVENSYFKFRMIPRSSESMIAFYEARGFSKAALALIKETCFITAIVRNKNKAIVWTDLKNWRFFNKDNEVMRLNRAYWNTQWQNLNIAQASRSTFEWTLMPEQRDLQFNEPVGGNVIIPKPDSSFDIEVIFVTGKNKRGPEIKVHFKNLRCPKDKN